MTTTWDALVTTGLLGTDRREPPGLPPGPVADVVADALDDTPAGRLLTAVAATVVARRCGIVADPPRPLLQPPPADDRPLLPPAAARRWHSVASYFPILEPEWIATASAAGWRPTPDVLVSMLQRARRSSERFAAALEFGGDLAAWLVDQLPDELSRPSGRAGSDVAELVVPPELRAAFDLPAEEFAAVVVTGIAEGVFRWAHRGVLLNTVAAMPPSFLDDLVTALTAGREAHDEAARSGHQAPGAAPVGLWESVLELAAVRRDMLRELAPPPPEHHG